MAKRSTLWPLDRFRTSNLFHPLLLLIASATDRQLARHVQYLKEENRILRARLPKRIVVTGRERQRLLKFGRPLGPAIKELITIVTPGTFFRWMREATSGKTAPKNSGRPRTAEEIRQLIVKLGRENGWGGKRVAGELKKLGVFYVCLNTIFSILKEHGIENAPKRGPGTWDEFVKRHASTLYACDFFSKQVWTLKGRVHMYLLVFIHIGSRRIWVSKATAHPDAQWVAQQARNVCMLLEERNEKAQYLIRDRDTKFTRQFDETFRAAGIRPVRLPVKSPYLNPYCERVIKTIKHEAINHFVVFGEDHLNHIVSEFVRYYHEHRPHQALGNKPPAESGPPPEPSALPLDAVVCHEGLGGLLKHYERRAA